MIDIVTAAARSSTFTRMGEGDVAALADGELLLAFMAFSGDGSDIAPTQIVSRRSSDGGRSWADHQTVATTDPGDINVYSPNLIRGLDGSLLLVLMRQHTHTPPTSTLQVWHSLDEGRSFSQRTVFAEHQDFSLCNGVIKRLADGRLLLPVTTIASAGANAYAHSYHGTALYSDDDGHSWQRSENDVALPMRGVMEPHVEQTADGRVLMVMRNQLGSLFIAESTDAGVHWGLPQTCGLRTPEACPELVRIADSDDLLMIWNNSAYDPGFTSHYGKRSPLAAAVSQDGGRSWGSPRNIEDAPNRAFSNPGCRFVGDTAIVNYWTCEYRPGWSMQDLIDLRVAIIDRAWFYGD
jgi:sialidase-1